METGYLVILCIRPENVTLSDIASGITAGTRNTFPATVVRITPMGPYQKVQLNCGFPLVTFATSRTLSDLGLKEGDRAPASFKTKEVHVIRGASRSVLT